MKRGIMRLTAIIIAISLPLFAHAGCVGDATFSECVDAQGNPYTVRKDGVTTKMEGRILRSGKKWSQTIERYGRTEQISGIDPRGRHWNMTVLRIGTTRVIHGRDGDGIAYASRCNGHDCRKIDPDQAF